MKDKLLLIYKILLSEFGKQYWWPGETRFEVCIGAILTQNTNWQNVEKAINNLKRKNLLSPYTLEKIDLKKLAAFIKPSGYFNQKSKKIKEFLKWFKKYNYNFEEVMKRDTFELRKELLNIWGIGEETADSILLYALDKPIFVVDAYTKRLFVRHNFIKEKDAKYKNIQSIFMNNLPLDKNLFNEYHALIVKLGKIYCKKQPLCNKCVLNKRELFL